MKSDFSQIPTSGCNYITSPTQIINRSGNVNKTFTLIGQKFIHTRTTENPYTDNSYECIQTEDLPYYAEEFEPLYMTNALMVALVVFGLAFYVIFSAVIRRFK